LTFNELHEIIYQKRKLFRVIFEAWLTLKMEAVRFFEASINFCQTTWRHLLEDSALHAHRLHELKPHKEPVVFHGFPDNKPTSK
jgi:hypothetical protein